MSEARQEFEKASQEKDLSLVQEFLLFLSENKKWWLLPILVVFGGLIIVSYFMGTGLAPFLYPMM